MANPKNEYHNNLEAVGAINAVEALLNKKTKITYKFENHFHPFVGDLIERLNKKSLDGLYDVGFQKNLEKPDLFKNEYDPNRSDNTLEVKDPKWGIDVDGGPYSVYNWELFFHVPLTVATHLSKNQKFAEAQRWFHYIFDPTSNDKSVDPPSRFWKFLRFREKTDVKLINEIMFDFSDPNIDPDLQEQVQQTIDKWRDDPFQPHVVASNPSRFLSYQINVIMKYLDNVVAWGDSLFRQDTIETINEATQMYVLAANILGPRPQKLPVMGRIQPKTYHMIKKQLDDFGNAMVEMEVKYPFNLGIPGNQNGTERDEKSQANVLFGLVPSLYFCIPQNDQLLAYWDLVADRLFKIRHCMNIEGVVRQLALFEPPIDPGMLVKAAAAGIDIGSLVSGLNQPISSVRAPFLIQKALEICSEVRTLGSSVLSALEKKDVEELALKRQEHEIKILQLVKDVRYLQWKEAESATQALLASRAISFQRYRHYQLLLGKKDEDFADVKEPTAKTILERKEINEENFDEVYTELVEKYDKTVDLENYRKEFTESLGTMGEAVAGVLSSVGVGGDGSASNNLELNKNEDKELNTFMPLVNTLQQSSAVFEAVASGLSLIPQFDASARPMGPGVGVEFGGKQISTFTSLAARILKIGADEVNYYAIRASKLGSYHRRLEDWIFQNNMAASELMNIGRQIISSLIREQITLKEYKVQEKQIEHAIELDKILNEKFTNYDFYVWMQTEISKVYYNCYKFAFDIAKKAEQTMKHELMVKELDDIDFIKFNYWDTGRKGLLSGESLYMDLKRMEMAYHEYNRREYEITKHVSLQQLDSKALLRLKATGSCEITIPEWIFDIDCPSHYMRRIKTVSLSIPSVVGPYSSINCTLSLIKSSIRRSPIIKDEGGGGGYARQSSEDDRFKDYLGTIQSIVTSFAQNDSGLFETNLRDERYLPFEGAGAVESTWKIELPNDFRQFDYNTISDVILHIKYTAREGGALLKSASVKQIFDMLEDAKKSPLARAFSLKHDFSTEYHSFISSSDPDETLKVIIKKNHFPYIASRFNIKVNKIELFTIRDGKIGGKDVTNQVNLDEFNSNLNNNNDIESRIEVPSDDKVLLHSKEEIGQIFLVLSYSIER